jgi:hypothetical protein
VNEPLRGSGRPPLTQDAVMLVNATRDLIAAADGMHGVERRVYGEILPCGQGRPCHTCEVIARVHVLLRMFTAGREP